MSCSCTGAWTDPCAVYAHAAWRLHTVSHARTLHAASTACMLVRDAAAQRAWRMDPSDQVARYADARAMPLGTQLGSGDLAALMSALSTMAQRWPIQDVHRRPFQMSHPPPPLHIAFLPPAPPMPRPPPQRHPQVDPAHADDARTAREQAAARRRICALLRPTRPSSSAPAATATVTAAPRRAALCCAFFHAHDTETVAAAAAVHACSRPGPAVAYPFVPADGEPLRGNGLAVADAFYKRVADDDMLVLADYSIRDGLGRRLGHRRCSRHACARPWGGAAARGGAGAAREPVLDGLGALEWELCLQGKGEGPAPAPPRPRRQGVVCGSGSPSDSRPRSLARSLAVSAPGVAARRCRKRGNASARVC
eukprot:352756-Chlamydomonas_euryale.AAC.7